MREIETIEGLEAGADAGDLPNDTHPGAVQTRFYVVKELLPAESERQGKPVHKNFVYVERKWDLGRTGYARRINDKVEFDDVAKRWKVVQLNTGITATEPPTPKSDIKRNTAEWNAFARGASQNEIGTPLEMLFRNDPSRAEAYRYHHVINIEALANVTDGQLEHLPMGARADRDRARQFIAKLESQAPQIAINNQLEEKDRQIQELSKRLEEMSGKLMQLLTAQPAAEEVEAPRRRERKPKIQIEEISGLEGKGE